MLTITSHASSSAGNLYTISNGRSRLIIELGIPWRKVREALGFNLEGVAGALVSHGHMDHAKAVKDAAAAGIDVYCSRQTAEMVGASGHRIFHVADRGVFNVGEWRVLPFSVEHDCPGSLGFLISTGKEKIIFLTDSSYCKYMFTGISHLMIEANFCSDILSQNVDSGLIDIARAKRILQSHMSIQRVKSFIAANDMSKLESVYLMHLSAASSDAERFKKEIQEITGVPVKIC